MKNNFRITVLLLTSCSIRNDLAKYHFEAIHFIKPGPRIWEFGVKIIKIFSGRFPTRPFNQNCHTHYWDQNKSFRKPCKISFHEHTKNIKANTMTIPEEGMDMKKIMYEIESSTHKSNTEISNTKINISYCTWLYLLYHSVG